MPFIRRVGTWGPMYTTSPRWALVNDPFSFLEGDRLRVYTRIVNIIFCDAFVAFVLRPETRCHITLPNLEQMALRSSIVHFDNTSI